MTPKTEMALRASIAKWEKNARVRKVENAKLGMHNCALCVVFIDAECVGCPVREKTGCIECENSPYPDAVEAKYESLPAFRTAAKAEVAFLQSLLPENQT